MIQDIAPKKLCNEYRNVVAEDYDSVFCFIGEQVLVKKENGKFSLPTAVEVRSLIRWAELRYLFSIEKERFFLLQIDRIKSLEGYEYVNVRSLRNREDLEICFAAATAYHLYRWYADNSFCGRCGQHMHHGENERMLYCPVCHMVIYPTIAPAVIIAVTSGDKLLLTKYADRSYKQYALIAGFTEIGETIEETVQREVYEEVGLKVKNIRYYKSQPWGVDSNVLMGFFAEVDGSEDIHLDHHELSVGEWVSREELDIEDDGVSLTREMIRLFKEGEGKNV